jgi:hypothetical protein
VLSGLLLALLKILMFILHGSPAPQELPSDVGVINGAPAVGLLEIFVASAGESFQAVLVLLILLTATLYGLLMLSLLLQLLMRFAPLVAGIVLAGLTSPCAKDKGAQRSLI